MLVELKCQLYNALLWADRCRNYSWNTMSIASINSTKYVVVVFLSESSRIQDDSGRDEFDGGCC